MMASAANGGGTKMTVAFAPVFHGFANRVEDGPAFVGGAALARGDACDDLGAVIGAGLGVERAFASGEALHHESGFFVDQYAHG
jgi:hypothetical protein